MVEKERLKLNLFLYIIPYGYQYVTKPKKESKELPHWF